MATTGTVTVVLADDDEDVRGALRQLFEDVPDIEVVAEAGSAAEAVAACAAHTPDVALLDVRMPGNGLRATREITADGPPTKVVILTADDTPETRAGAADSGAARFVVKSGGDDLVRVVRHVAGR